ncbi:primosomal protein N' [Aliidongia dinghuensis]|uniref:Replication restart protein PriA n=1 Tax=Aliidongia dinghuensis TaxID=1867774 RepID=A0A8J3E268_9PROT|nr:primosomal protein N' [Aliidongia dinghuensis]GGF08436.1 primosomal protein N' [Aliidongia dinghuensis]
MAGSSTSFAAPKTPQVSNSPQAGRVPVLLPLPLDGAYDYRAPAEMPPPGSFVTVPLGQRMVTGVVWDRSESGDDVAEPRLKPVATVHDAVAMRAPVRRLVDWVAAYTLSPPGAVLRMAMGPSDALEPEEGRVGFAVAPDLPGLDAKDRRLTATRRRVLAVFNGGEALPAALLAQEAGCGAGVIRAMAEAGLLVETRLPARPPRPLPDWRLPFPPLSDDQRQAADAIVAAVEARHYETILLDGVTGSGKTEVYFKAIAAALAAGRQVLVLLPEIALGAQWHRRFERQFGAPAAAWHSDLRPAERRGVWRDVADGRARVVVGARSALFLPFEDLGLIVVDEEHDASFKQEEGVVYHARDMAVVRASLEGVPIVLASATPSLESLVNAERGRYRRIVLPDRHGGAELPQVTLVDLREDKPERQRFVAPSLIAALKETLVAGEQAMLFLNRRGYAPLTLCRTCGHRMQCPNCTAWLVEHRFMGRLVCHHCGHAERPPEICPACEDKHSFAPCGPGVERLAEEIAERFPDARVAVMASDTLVGPQAMADLVARVQAHEIDLLIGTQIMAKGHHFPMLTLVGVIDGDLGLAGGDLRAGERTFQMLHQVAGRAGRAERPGRVLLQTFDPGHPVMQALAAHDRDRFLALESAERRSRHMPPFGRLAALIVSAPDADQADQVSAALARAAPHLKGVDVLGPAPAPLAVLRGRHRRRFLMKTDRQVNLQAVLRQWLSSVRVPTAVRVQVDVDPYSFL